MPIIQEPCASCGGRCCDRFAVGVTLADAKRLADAGHPLEEALAVQEHDADGARGFPALLVDGKKSILCLKRKKNQRCAFLKGDRSCAAYSARTMACRAYPFELRRGAVVKKENAACAEGICFGCGRRKENACPAAAAVRGT